MTGALPVLVDQPSPALEAPRPTGRPAYRSGPVLMAGAGLLAVVLAMVGMLATGAVAVERDQQAGRADTAALNTQTLAGQVAVACAAGQVAATPIGAAPCATAEQLAIDPTRSRLDGARLFDALRGLIARAPAGPARLDPARVIAGAAQDPALGDVPAGQLARTARAAVAAESGAVDDDTAAEVAGAPDPGPTSDPGPSSPERPAEPATDPAEPRATDVTFARDDEGQCEATTTYDDGSVERADADDASCGPPAGPPPGEPEEPADPAPSDPAPTTEPDPTSEATTDPTPTTDETTSDAPAVVLPSTDSTG